ncbi:MAG: dihydroorotase family protein [Patescibacteria group bacterium]|nr:dihydroorotase family protein [Patescibacteria group bacterium]
MADLILKNGKVVTPDGVRTADVVVENGKIVGIGQGSAGKEIDCSGKYILPGAIDAHVHFREPGMTHKEDFKTGSEAALAGGVTMILDMPNTAPPTVTIESLKEKKALAKEKCKCNFGFHFGITEGNSDILKKVEKDPYVYGFKAYMGESTGGMICSYELLDKVFEIVSKPVVAHAEDQEILEENMREFKGTEDPKMHSEIRSDKCARESVKKILHLAKKHDKKVHIAHVSSMAELEEIRKFKTDKVTCEVTPHHLFLNVHEYENQGNFVKTNPPLRTREDQEALWDAIDKGFVDIIATDHAPHTFEEKDVTYSKAPSGVPGVENMLPLLLNEVNKGRLTIGKVAELVSRRPAEIFGMKNKGKIEVGYDADLIVCDMDLEKTILNDHQKTKCKWTPFNGWKVKGWPVVTVCGGKIIQVLSRL